MSNKKAAEVRYQFREGARIKGATAEVVAAEMTTIANAKGGLSAPDVVAIAEPVKSRLHQCFEWNNLKAGNQYRLHQARNIIKSVVVVVDDIPCGPVVSYCPDKGAKSGENSGTDYKLTSVVVSRPDYFATAMADLVRRVSEAQRSVEALLRAATQEDEQDADRLARIGMAVQALQTAGAAVQALH